MTPVHCMHREACQPTRSMRSTLHAAVHAPCAYRVNKQSRLEFGLCTCAYAATRPASFAERPTCSSAVATASLAIMSHARRLSRRSFSVFRGQGLHKWDETSEVHRTLERDPADCQTMQLGFEPAAIASLAITSYARRLWLSRSSCSVFSGQGLRSQSHV